MKKCMLLLAGCLALITNAYADAIIAASPQDKLSGENKTVVIYGNSYSHYNNNVNTRLRDLTRSLLPNEAKGYAFRAITISSGRLGWHIPNLTMQNSLQKWDVVILQGNSTEPFSAKAESRDYFVESATKMADVAHKAGSKVVYFMTWANKDKPEQTAKLEKAYLDIASKTGGYMAPVGLAFSNAIKAHPEIDLYHSDGSHPSLAGTYLAACVLFATLYDHSPVGGALPVDSTMTEQTAKALQQVAWDTVTAFRAK
ncbi:hypothetical protein FHU10_2674 [Serratia fonticola]|jgi:hypothetical protein|uniref:SGNH/GDSL hydrolase family protein n=1 Tax=Serratia fonticola TaxID=47917 RepID=A0A542BUU6_SERFO|nr:DUF4886 domain-containing protein [Serratia fonticola]TQI82351.1 hypothetical protein FHU09_5034 [Serratia fonticola]TQI95629.1 hypothetical protein FHU11_1015 [Serratia fonticola]TVZ70125.1 hypothetical protein FHU10_2674 [Serratia fonticola]